MERGGWRVRIFSVGCTDRPAGRRFVGVVQRAALSQTKKGQPMKKSDALVSESSSSRASSTSLDSTARTGFLEGQGTQEATMANAVNAQEINLFKCQAFIQ